MMGEEQMARYSLYMSTLGNRPDLFPESAYVGKYITNPPADYDVPEEYLDDETFAAILGEAEKYLGYPYVWGGRGFVVPYQLPPPRRSGVLCRHL